MLYEKLDQNIPRLLDGSTITDPDNTASQIYSQKQFSQAFHEFSEICCSFDPSERYQSLLMYIGVICKLFNLKFFSRPTAVELLSHSFIRQSRRVTLDQLPGMLEPLKPLTDSVLKKSENTGAITSLTYDMSMASLHTDDGWVF